MVAQSMPDSTLFSQGAVTFVRTSGRLLRPTCGALTVKRKPEFHNFKTEVRRILSEMGYDFSNPCVLGKGEGILAPLESVTRKVMESTWFTTEKGLHNFTILGYQPTHLDMISSESEGSSFFENGTYEDNVQSHVISIVVEDASSDNEEELARVREAYFCDTKRPIPTLQHAKDIEDPFLLFGAFLTVQAKNKNDDILFYRGPYLPPPPPGPKPYLEYLSKRGLTDGRSKPRATPKKKTPLLVLLFLVEAMHEWISSLDEEGSQGALNATRPVKGN
ncbi:hypothetical protein Scep_031079 [Stephania cephalantha]|uniref:Uncharacterized protein n=1 Tax=Stephania cephalantha TaxID=152367 RepID=A0AAP0HBX3_9MAGN